MLYRPLPAALRVYALPFVSLYAVAAGLLWHHHRSDDGYGGDGGGLSSEGVLLVVLLLVSIHALSFLFTQWSVRARARLTARPTRSLRTAQRVLVLPRTARMAAGFVPLERVRLPGGDVQTSFTHQGDKYVYTIPGPSSAADLAKPVFRRIPYPVDTSPPFSELQAHTGLAGVQDVLRALLMYGPNLLSIPVPTFVSLFAQHAMAPFFVFQVFCVCLWMLDEYWYYSLFSLAMLVLFESMVVFQRLQTLREFRTMTIKPFPIWVFRAHAWSQVSSAELVPGDLISIQRSQHDSGLPCDMVLCTGSAIVNEAMLSGESTPLLKDSIALRNSEDRLDVQGADRNSVLYAGTKVLQTTARLPSEQSDAPHAHLSAPDEGALAIVARTGFGTTQGGLVRLMVYNNNNRATAGDWESVVFLLFLLSFALAASGYVWVHGAAMGRNRKKLLLDCILIITSVVPPELPMELSMAVNASLQSLSRFAIFCTEPFRIPYAGKVEVCCFDKTGTITSEDLLLQGVAQIGSGGKALIHAPHASSRETTLTIAAAHALVLLPDDHGEVVGDPMEKTSLQTLGWEVCHDDIIAPLSPQARQVTNLQIRRRFPFSSALKRMSTISIVADALPRNDPSRGSSPSGTSKRTFVAVKGAPETLRSRYASLPVEYDEVFKTFTRQGGRVLALGYKWLPSYSIDDINAIPRERVEEGLSFAGFLVFYSPLKPDAARALMHLNDSAHRCIMITGDHPLTAIHVAEQVEIVDRKTLILDLQDEVVPGHGGQEGKQSERDEKKGQQRKHIGRHGDMDGDGKTELSRSPLVFRSVDDDLHFRVDPDKPLDEDLFGQYDVCVTGSALKMYETRPNQLAQLVQNTWVYARVSPQQKELVLSSLRNLGYVTLMAGDGTNDVGALKAADVGLAILNGTLQDMEKIAEHKRFERMKTMHESQVALALRMGKQPPPLPLVLAQRFPEMVLAPHPHRAMRAEETSQSRLGAPTSGPSRLNGQTPPPVLAPPSSSTSASAPRPQPYGSGHSSSPDSSAPPQIRLGDASVAAPFTSKLAQLSSVISIIRQGRSTLVAFTQMHKILALNCLVSAYSLSVLHLHGIKQGDYQSTVSGMLMSIGFFCVSCAKPTSHLAPQRPQGNVVCWYMLLSVLLQFGLHCGTMQYVVSTLVPFYEPSLTATSLAPPPAAAGAPARAEGPGKLVDLEATFAPSLLNTAIYLLGLSQQVNTFMVNFIGRPHRESLQSNRTMLLGLLACLAVSLAGALQLVPAMNYWLELVPLETPTGLRLAGIMVLDFAGCFALEWATRCWLADTRAKPLVTKHRDGLRARRAKRQANFDAVAASLRGSQEKKQGT